MSTRPPGRPFGLCFAAIAFAALLAATGCGYLRNRGQDALDMFDLGFTFTRKPQFGIYGNCPFMAPAGYAKVDGTYAGIGGGQVGVMEHHQDNVGLVLWGHENVGWTAEQGDGAEPPVGETKGVHPLGLATDPEGHPGYHPQCAHYLHLGFVGVTANANYREWGDFLLGWVGVDISHDDGKPRGTRTCTACQDGVCTTDPEAAEETPPPAEDPPATEFCLRCGGRRFVGRWPPVPTGEAEAPSLPAAQKAWPGRWCTCWETQARAKGGPGTPPL